MSKLQLFLVSWVAALPGALLLFLTVMSFITFGGGSNVMLQGLGALTVLASALLTLMPFGVLIFGPRSASAPKKPKTKKEDKQPGKQEGKSKAGGKPAIHEEPEDLQTEEPIEEIPEEPIDDLTSDHPGEDLATDHGEAPTGEGPVEDLTTEDVVEDLTVEEGVEDLTTFDEEDAAPKKKGKKR